MDENSNTMNKFEMQISNCKTQTAVKLAKHCSGGLPALREPTRLPTNQTVEPFNFYHNHWKKILRIILNVFSNLLRKAVLNQGSTTIRSKNKLGPKSKFRRKTNWERKPSIVIFLISLLN